MLGEASSWHSKLLDPGQLECRKAFLKIAHGVPSFSGETRDGHRRLHATLLHHVIQELQLCQEVLGQGLPWRAEGRQGKNRLS